jgi:hypothetical protein
MFRLIASHHQAKELKDLSKQLLHIYVSLGPSALTVRSCGM